MSGSNSAPIWGWNTLPTAEQVAAAQQYQQQQQVAPPVQQVVYQQAPPQQVPPTVHIQAPPPGYTVQYVPVSQPAPQPVHQPVAQPAGSQLHGALPYVQPQAVPQRVAAPQQQRPGAALHGALPYVQPQSAPQQVERKSAPQQRPGAALQGTLPYAQPQAAPVASAPQQRAAPQQHHGVALRNTMPYVKPQQAAAASASRAVSDYKNQPVPQSNVYAAPQAAESKSAVNVPAHLRSNQKPKSSKPKHNYPAKQQGATQAKVAAKDPQYRYHVVRERVRRPNECRKCYQPYPLPKGATSWKCKKCGQFNENDPYALGCNMM